MNEITIFEHFEFGKVRTVIIDNIPYWVGRDICSVLGYSNPNKALTDHCKGITKRYPLQTEGGIQDLRLIAEPDLLRLIVSSKLPNAKKFEQWIFEQVLPEIHKTGQYSIVKDFSNLPNFRNPGEAARAWADQYDRAEKAEEILSKEKPKIEFYNAVAGSKDAVEMSAVAKMLDKKIGRNQLFHLLREKKILRDNNEPYQEYVDRGWFRVIEQKYQTPTGETKISIKPLVYQKGIYNINRMLTA